VAQNAGSIKPEVAVAGTIDAVFKLTVAGSILAASISVGYYYSIYLPERDRQADIERRLLAARSEIARQAEQTRATAQQEEMRQRLANEKAAVQSRYQDCVSKVNRIYSVGWASQCKAIADRNVKSYNECVSKGTAKETCDIFSKSRDNSSDCSLPRVLATDLDTDAERGRNRCLEESKSGLQ
jgi:hypothetical protein